MKENERKMKEYTHFSLRNTVVPPRRALQNVLFPLKNGKCRNDKNGLLKNVHCGPENIGEPPSNVWFSWVQSAFSECQLFPRELGEPLCSSPYPQASVNFSECGLSPKEKGTAVREGTARGLILLKRDKYL